jgi:hypothetical protein
LGTLGTPFNLLGRRSNKLETAISIIVGCIGSCVVLSPDLKLRAMFYVSILPSFWLKIEEIATNQPTIRGPSAKHQAIPGMGQTLSACIPKETVHN